MVLQAAQMAPGAKAGGGMSAGCIIGIVVAAVALVTIGVVAWNMVRVPAPLPERRELAIDRDPRLAEPWSGANLLAISPDGATIVFRGIDDSGGGPGRMRLYVRRLDELQSAPLRDTEDAAAPFFSPDGEQIGFFQDGMLRIVAVAGGKPREVCDAGRRHLGGTWAGDTIVFSSGGRLWRVEMGDEQSDKRERFLVPRTEEDEVAYRWPQFVPGGEAVVYSVVTASTDSLDDARIDVVNLQSGERRRVLDGAGAAVATRSGHLVYDRSGSLWAAELDLDTYKIDGQPVEIIPGIEGSPSGAPQFVLAVDAGTLAYVPGSPMPDERQLVWVDRPNRMTNAVDRRLNVSAVEISPDGSMVATDTSGDNADIVVFDLVASRPMARVGGDWMQRFGAWVNNERFVFWARNERGRFVYSHDLESGISEPLAIELGEYSQPYPANVSPDGTTLAIDAVHPDTGSDLLLVPLDADPVPQVLLATSAWEEWPRFSPDGELIAYISGEEEEEQVYVMSASAPGERGLIVPTPDCHAFRWAREGRTLYCIPHERRGLTAQIVVEIPLGPGPEPMFGDPVEAFHLDEPLTWWASDDWDVGHDGRLLFMMEPPYAMPTKIFYVSNWFSELERRVPEGQ